MNSPVDKVNITESINTGENSTMLDVATIVQDMLDLKVLLEKETKWLQAMNVEKVKDIHDEKLRLIRRLEIQKELIAKDPAIIEQGSAEEKLYLQQLQGEMDQVVKANFTEVLKAREINKRVVDVIANAVGQHETRAAGYDQGGSSYGISGKPPSIDKSYAVTINQTI